MSLTYTDVFCGAGGSSIGLTEAGLELKLAANHWERAIETHSANFRDAEHLCADVSNYDMRRLPRTDILWASPICTEISPAGGRARRAPGQLDLLEESGHVPKAGLERTRATFHDVIRATEVHRYKAVIIENVTEAADWELFDWWLGGMILLGYNHQFVSVSSAHVGGDGNPHAPQWRDRLYIVFTRKGIALPDVSPRPLAWCFKCEAVVESFQAWKKPGARKIGKYGQQYVYCCSNTACGHSAAEPLVLPAASAIDWSDLGTRIGDRPKTKAKPEGLAPATIRRVRAGLTMFAQPVTVAVGGNTYERPGSGYVRAWPVERPLNARTGTPAEALAVSGGMVLPVGGANHDQPGTRTSEPFRTRVTRDTDALVTQPFVTMLRGPKNAPTEVAGDALATMTTGRNHGLTVPPFFAVLRNRQVAQGVDEPLSTVATSGAHHGLTVPDSFLLKNYGGYLTPERNVSRVDQPVSPITAQDHHALVVPYRRGRATTTAGPLHTLATRESAGLVQPDNPDVADCRFRMLKPREHLRAQRFPDSYIVTGNQGEQTMQAGNAVSANVAHWLGNAVAAVLA
ncbi:MAG TPA: DNA cytosine methyltransferase [Trebonia sp.]|jgi:DNA (cytosine-5)-methyltransferase 1